MATIAKSKDQAGRQSLRTLDDLIEAGEWMYNKQRRGELDAKAADGMNTTIKGQRYLIVDLRVMLLKEAIKAAKSKLRIDPQVFQRLGVAAPVVPTAEQLVADET